MNGVDVRALRQRLGLTQVELARRLGVYQSAIGRWETDVHRPSPYYARALLALLDESEQENKEAASATTDAA